MAECSLALPIAAIPSSQIMWKINFGIIDVIRSNLGSERKKESSWWSVPKQG